MRTINLRFATQLFLTIVGLSIGTFYLHRVQYERIAHDLQWQVNYARESGNTSEAIAYTYRYLTFKPNDVKVLIELANALEPSASGKPQQAEVVRLLESVLRIEPGRADTRRRIIALYLRMRQFADCLDHLEQLLQDSANDGELLCWLAECRQATGKHSAAAQAYEKAIAADPKRLTTYFKYADLLNQQLGRPDDARRILQCAIAIEPGRAEAQAALARFQKRNGKLLEAKTAVLEATRLTPQDAANLGLAGEIHQALGEFQIARDYYQQARSIDPSNSQYVCTLVWLLLCEGQVGDANACLQGFMRDHPNNVDAIILLGEIVSAEGRIEAIESLIGHANSGPDQTSAPSWMEMYLTARLKMRRGELSVAVFSLEELRMAAAKAPAMVRHATYLQALCYEQLGEVQKEVEAYRQLVDADPGSGIFRLQLARALARAGQFDKAVAEFRSAVPCVDLPALVVRSATVELTERLQHNGGSRFVHELERGLGSVRTDEASANAILAAVEMHRLCNHYPAALKLADHFLQKQSTHAPMLAARVRVLESMFGPARANSAIKDAQAKCGDQPEFRVARLQLVTSLSDEPSENLSQLVQFSANDRSAIVIEAIASFGAAGDLPHMREAVHTLRQFRLDHTGVRGVLLTAALWSKNSGAVNELLADLQSIEGPNSRTARRFAAERLLASEPNAARKALDELSHERPNDPIIALLHGRADEADNQPSALAYYQKALDLGLLDQPIEEQFWSLHQQAGRPCRVLLVDSPLVERLRLEQDRAVVHAVFVAADPAARGTLADRLLRANPDATSAQLVWLGRVFQTFNLQEQREQAFARAKQLSPEMRW